MKFGHQPLWKRLRKTIYKTSRKVLNSALTQARLVKPKSKIKVCNLKVNIIYSKCGFLDFINY